jgi:hypothetical protein
VSINVNASTKCKLGTVTSTGTFRMAANGPGGWVSYEWIRKDSNGPVIIAEAKIWVNPGDASAHSVATDSWNAPASAGTVQLVFTNPSYSVAPQSFTCRP